MITKVTKDVLGLHRLLRIEERNQTARLEYLMSNEYEPGYSERSGVTEGTRSTTPSDPTPMEVIRLEQLQDHINKLRQRIKEEEQMIDSLLLRLKDPNERLVIRMRYFDCLEWPTIAETIQKVTSGVGVFESYQTRAFRLHHRALDDLKQLMSR